MVLHRRLLLRLLITVKKGFSAELPLKDLSKAFRKPRCIWFESSRIARQG